MHITLTCVAFQDAPPPEEQVVSVTDEGATIGRSKDCDFVIMDPDHYASRRHARVSVDGDAVYIEDTSNNGTLVNDSVELFPGQRHQLEDGDLLQIGEVTIEVGISQPEQAPAPRNDVASSIDDAFNFALPGEEPATAQEPEPLPEPEPEPEPVRRPEPVVSSPTPPAEPARKKSRQERLAERAAAREAEQPAPIVSPAQQGDTAIDPSLAQKREEEARRAEMAAQRAAHPVREDSTDRTGGAAPPPAREPVPAQRQAPPPVPEVTPDPVVQPSADEYAADSQAIDVFLAELDINPEELEVDIVEIMGIAGIVLKTLTQGIMDMLKARSSVKKNFGMDTTKIKGVRNNALKFSLSPEEALTRLLNQEAGFLNPLQSVEEAVHDAQAHQVAMVSGMNAAIQALLAKFDPEALEESMSQGFTLSRKAKYWDIYTEQYAQIAKESEDHFNDLFAEEFRKTYEEQVRQLQGKK